MESPGDAFGFDGLVQDEEIDPFLNDIVGPRADQFLKIFHFTKFQRHSSGHFRIANLGDGAIQDNDLGLGLAPLTFPMQMDELWVIRWPWGESRRIGGLRYANPQYRGNPVRSY